MEAIAIRLEAIATRLEAIATRLEAIAIRLKAIATRLEAIATRLEAIAIRLEAIATRLEAIATRLEAIAIRLEGITRLEGIAIRLEGITTASFEKTSIESGSMGAMGAVSQQRRSSTRATGLPRVPSGLSHSFLGPRRRKRAFGTSCDSAAACDSWTGLGLGEAQEL